MPTTVTNENSNYATSNVDAFAFTAIGKDTLTVKQDGFLIATAASRVGAKLSGGPWTVAIDGNVTSLAGIGLLLDAAPSGFTSSITIGTEGDIYGTFGIRAFHATNITNKGYVYSTSGSSSVAVDMQASGDFKIANSGTLDGFFAGISLTGNGVHTITNSKVIVGVTNAIIATGSSGVEKVTNTGIIEGAVKLGAGDDSFTNSGKGVVVDGISVLGVIDMGAGNDKFMGGAGVDSVIDGTGNDSYTLGGGNDLFKAAATPPALEFDKIDGGTGNDTVDYSGSSAALVLNLDTKAHGVVDLPDFYDDQFSAGLAGTLDTGGFLMTTLASVKYVENVKGSIFGDLLFGSAAVNVLEGNGGADDLWGFAGNDTLNGGAGIDFLIGGAGKDTMTGGTEADNFIFLKTTDSGITDATRDLIKDFNVAGGDLIGLSFIDAKIGVSNPGDDVFTLLAGPNSKFNGKAGELRYEWTGLDTIIEGDVNGDKKADFSIALEGRFTLSAGDFEL